MNYSVVIIGLGEMGGVFARGFLRLGIPVYPVIRTMNIQTAAEAMPNPALVLLAVAEADLQSSLEMIPSAWKQKLALLQNELLPRDWQHHDLNDPTIISVWFEKKKGQDVKVLIDSPAFGPSAALLKAALATISVPVYVVPSAEDMLNELILKNIYILTTNIAGLECGGDVNALWHEHNELMREVAEEVMDIQAWLTGETLNRPQLYDGFLKAINGDLAHKCMGRSAPARLSRAISLADEAGLKIPKLSAIANRHIVK